MIQATLLLEGGAARGVFTSGVLDYLLEKDCMVSDVIGLSAGASNALGYVAKQLGWAKECIIREDGSFHYYSIKSLLTKRSLMNMDLMFDKMPNEIEPFDYDSYFASDINVHMGVANCKNGVVEYRSEKENGKRLMQLCCASCSLPLLAPSVKIDGVSYLDGGMVDSVPVQYAQSLGNDKLVVVLTRNPGYRKGQNSKLMVKLFQFAYRKCPEFAQGLNSRFQLYNSNVEKLEQLEKEGKAFVIRPQIELCGRMEEDPTKLSELYNHGYQYMQQQYDNLLEYLGMK